MTKLEQKMGNNVWMNYLTPLSSDFLHRFGMGDESFGGLPSDNYVTQAMSSFGQGISVTQTQMLRAFSAIANDGEMLEPKFISAIYDKKSDTARKSKKKLLENQFQDQLRNRHGTIWSLVGTDPEYGTLYSDGPIIQVPGQNVAVKSGTAQIATDQGYLQGENDYINSVVAMTPAEDPWIHHVCDGPTTRSEILSDQLGRAGQSYFGRCSCFKDELHLTSEAPTLDGVTKETTYKIPSVETL